MDEQGMEQGTNAGNADCAPARGDALGTAARFAPGQVVATPAALGALSAVGVPPGALLSRHLRGDWGERRDHDRAQNERALSAGERLLSAYRLPGGETVWVITEADRSATTLLTPAEY